MQKQHALESCSATGWRDRYIRLAHGTAGRGPQMQDIISTFDRFEHAMVRFYGGLAWAKKNKSLPVELKSLR